MRRFTQNNFNKGTIDTIEDFSIPEQASSKSLNWLTKGDKIELSGGYSIIDDSHILPGLGRVTGLHIASKVDGTKQAFYSYGKKVKYLENSVWKEIGTDILGTNADGEDISFTEYISLSGYQTWFSSPNSGLYKILTANPSNYIDITDTTKNFSGYISAYNSRLFLWYKKKAKNYLQKIIYMEVIKIYKTVQFILQYLQKLSVH